MLQNQNVIIKMCTNISISADRPYAETFCMSSNFLCNSGHAWFC